MADKTKHQPPPPITKQILTEPFAHGDDPQRDPSALELAPVDQVAELQELKEKLALAEQHARVEEARQHALLKTIEEQRIKLRERPTFSEGRTAAPPVRGEQIDGQGMEPAAYHRPSMGDLKTLAADMAEDLSAKELEALASELLKKAGKAGKSPTGRHIVKHGFMRDATGAIPKPHHVIPFRRREDKDGKIIEERVVLDDLTEEEVKHLTKHGAIEPEYE